MTSTTVMDGDSMDQDDQINVLLSPILIVIIASCLLLLCCLILFLARRRHKGKQNQATNIKMADIGRILSVSSDQVNTEINELDRQAVSQWLKAINMSQYYPLFIANGFESMKVVKIIEGKDELKEIGVNVLGHRSVIMEAIKKLRANNGYTEGLDTNETTNETDLQHIVPPPQPNVNVQINCTPDDHRFSQSYPSSSSGTMEGETNQNIFL